MSDYTKHLTNLTEFLSRTLLGSMLLLFFFLDYVVSLTAGIPFLKPYLRAKKNILKIKNTCLGILF